MIPTYESFMLPLLRLLSDGQTRSLSGCREALANEYHFSAEDLAQMLPSGRRHVFNSRVHWAKTYLGKAGLVESPSRGSVRISASGTNLLAENPATVTTAFLTERYAAMREWRDARPSPSIPLVSGGKQSASASTGAPVVALSPEEALDASYQQIRESTEADILERAMAMPPLRFEYLVLDLLLRLGYGGVFGTGEHLGGTGDGGVDGVIWQDKLGLDLIYVQAKRWQGTVGSKVIREFAGSLAAHRARKGVIITTSSFSRDALADVERMAERIVLIDGQRLAALMFESDLGVAVESSYQVKRIDSDYFEHAE